MAGFVYNWFMWIPLITAVIRPKSLNFRGGPLHFNYGRAGSAIERGTLGYDGSIEAAPPRRLPKELWREFLDLNGKRDDAVIQFARTHGPITRALASEESIEDWRRKIRLLAVINAALESPDDETASAWQTVQEETRIPVDDPWCRRSALSAFLKKVVKSARPEFTFAWPKKTLEVKLYTDSLWTGLVFQLVNNFLCAKQQMVPCGGCGQLLKKRGHSGKNQFCQRCRNAKVPVKLAMRRRRARLKRAARKQR
jgi:hypothetical protein